MFPIIIKMTGATVVNDAGCGDLFWIQQLNLSNVDYLGYDLYERSTWPALREKGWQLQTADIVNEDLRPSGITMCRDVFIHLPNYMILNALARLKKTTNYLFTTTYTDVSNDGRMAEPRLQHAKMDLTKAPFNLGEPRLFAAENYPGKYMGLWRLR